MPRIFPSRVAPTVMCWTCPRPCVVATWCSERVSVHFTGRLSRRARTSARASSAYTLSFAPKPPPTSGATTRSLVSEMPQIAARMSRTKCGTCVEVWRVKPPPTASGVTTTARVSIGEGITRCWT